MGICVLFFFLTRSSAENALHDGVISFSFFFKCHCSITELLVLSLISVSGWSHPMFSCFRDIIFFFSLWKNSVLFIFYLLPFLFSFLTLKSNPSNFMTENVAICEWSYMRVAKKYAPYQVRIYLTNDNCIFWRLLHTSSVLHIHDSLTPWRPKKDLFKEENCIEDNLVNALFDDRLSAIQFERKHNTVDSAFNELGCNEIS